jgi:hypothetical protein
MRGQQASYDWLPYFYTDQYDLGTEYTGYTDPDGFDQVVSAVTPQPESSSRSGCAKDASWPG